MPTASIPRTKDNGALVNALIFAIGTGSVLYYIYLGSPANMPEETCLGTHTSATTIKASETRLISAPFQGFDYYEIDLSPECESLELSKNAIGSLGRPSLCVGDDLKSLGATDAACRVTALHRIRETQAKR